MPRLASLLLTAALQFGCSSDPIVGEVVDSSFLIVLETPEGLDSSCLLRGRVAASGDSAYCLPFFDNQAIAEAEAMSQLLDHARELGANTVVLDAEATVEKVPLDATCRWGVHLEGDAYSCEPRRPAA